MIKVKEHFVFPSNLKNVKPIVDKILALLKDKKVCDSDIFDIRLSLEEAIINAMKYGNHFEENRKVKVDFTYENDEIDITIEDEGKGFDYRNLPDPTKEENLFKTKGRGVFLIEHLMDKVKFNKNGNQITMLKHLKR